MTIFLYRLTVDPRKVDKTGGISPVSDITGYDAQTGMSGTFRDRCDMVDPVIMLEINSAEIVNLNYIYISEWSRYYFVKHITAERNNLVTLYCHEDVLFSFASGIKSMSAYVLRQELNYKPFIVDNKRIFGINENLSLIVNSSAPTDFDPTQYGNPGGIRFVVSLATQEVFVGSYHKTSTDWIVYPGLPGTSAGIGFRSWALDRTEINDFFDEFLGLSGDVLTALYGVGTESIIAVKSLPFSLVDSTTTGEIIDQQTATNLKIMNKPLTTTGHAVREIAYKVINFGNYQYSATATDFSDFEPFTRAQMFLPYYGVIDVPMVYMANGGVDVTYRIECHTGDCVITVQSHDNDSYVRTLFCNVAEDVPITHTNSVEQARNQLNSALNMVSGGAIALAGNPMGLLPMAQNVVNMGLNNVTMTGSLNSPNMQRMLRYTPYVLISKKPDITPSGYSHYFGLPCEEVLPLSGLTGFTVIGEVIGRPSSRALEDEQDEIYSLLKSGVIF